MSAEELDPGRLRDRPVTGDEVVDEVLTALAREAEDAEGALGQQITALDRAHRALQERLGR